MEMRKNCTFSNILQKVKSYFLPVSIILRLIPIEILNKSVKLKSPFCAHAHSAPIPEPARICKPFKEPRNRFPAWRAGPTTLFVVPARYVSKTGGIESPELILGLLKRFQMQALYTPSF
jgi:hypothetical protein